ncbi:hypothetical protein HELRODRAFT_93045, partial [Helobdella robusta]|uniref:TSP C-terminal domain-containing protein n=1 Tax=Helobdella robusta TaxID=6412 RepID=T1G8R8_HELRO
QNDRRFYVVMWKKEHQTYWKQEPFRAVGDAGVQIKVVHSIEGPGEMMRNSLWHREGKEDETRNLFNDENKIGWQAKTSYRWELMHRPSIGLIRVKFFNDKRLIVDSGDLFDNTYRGGRVGLFCFSQSKVIWSDLVTRCNGQYLSVCVSVCVFVRVFVCVFVCE